MLHLFGDLDGMRIGDHEISPLQQRIAFYYGVRFGSDDIHVCPSWRRKQTTRRDGDESVQETGKDYIAGRNWVDMFVVGFGFDIYRRLCSRFREFCGVDGCLGEKEEMKLFGEKTDIALFHSMI
ncbi:MAG: hypothetical protein FWG34_11960 [Oscillospiraceae bacterium]|nr:hypothetical protein [Oscillospiraceae bacterium]